MYSSGIVKDIENVFKKNHLYFSNIKGFNVMAAMGSAAKGATAAAISEQFLAYGIYGTFDGNPVNTNFILTRLNKDGCSRFNYKFLYRPKSKEVIRLEEVELTKIVVNQAQDPFYWCRCEHFSVEKVNYQSTVRNTTSTQYYNLFLDYVVNLYGNNIGLEEWMDIKGSIGAIEFDPQTPNEDKEVRTLFNQYFTGKLLNKIVPSQYVKDHLTNFKI